jgi:uncharacterized YigZ family protein
MTYNEPIDTAHIEIVIKKSRFIGFAKKVVTREEAIEFIKELRESYPDARHVCWAYLLGDPNNSTNCASNDDGEPSGTAGKPILAQINYNNIGNVVVVIVRYFGGIRLGAGGLVRAYRKSAQQALLGLTTEEYIPQEEILIELPFNEENTIRQALASFNGEIISCDYDSMVALRVLLPVSNIHELELLMVNMSANIKR